MEQNQNRPGKAVELRSVEVQEVMNRIPSAIERRGMTLMAVIITGLFVASAYIRWPQTIECPFEWIPDEDESEITAILSTEALTYISSNKDTEVTLHSPMFPAEYFDNGVSGSITDFTVENSRSDGYVVRLDIDLPDKIFKEDCDHIIVGNLLLLTSDDTLLKHIISHTKPL